MATQIAATTHRTQPAPRLGIRKVAILVVMAVAVIGVGVWGLAGSSRDVTLDGSARVGVPLHGGLAGPSRVGQVDLTRHYGPGYPHHGGLAGPSRVDSGD